MGFSKNRNEVKEMGKVTINGKTISFSGNSVCIQNNKVYVDGKLLTGEDAKEPVKLVIEGEPVNVKTQGDIEVHGNVKGKVDAGGSVTCGDVGGTVDAGGSVHSGDVSGSVDAGGSVHCGNVSGDVECGGNVTRKY